MAPVRQRHARQSLVEGHSRTLAQASALLPDCAGGLQDSSMTDVVRLTAVANQGQADVICSLLRAYGIRCSERAASESGEPAAVGGWREILVGTDDLDAAREVMAAKPVD